MKKTLLLAAGCIALTAFISNAQTTTAPEISASETKAQRDARMAWWREAKFGMFIHWGVYAVPAGTYKGEPVKGIGEWIMLNGKIPVSEYRAFARDFNPVKYDPQAWAKLAREAGMKYVVITAKHHDGFALYPSDVTDWDIADATPYGKDLLTPLAQAMRKQGLKFGTYYSQAQDWTHPGGAKSRYQEGEGWDDAQKGSFDDYLTKIAVPQTREILTRLKPDVLWWDTPTWMNPERAKPLHDLLAFRPKLITNNRLMGKGGAIYQGDTETPEQHIPATGFGDRDWETCMTMNDTWGYKSYDHNWKSTKTIIRNLVDIVSKGGNYLLNVGPTAEGEIPAQSIQRLKEVGAWVKVNGDAIYGTTASPFRKLAWGRCTTKAGANGGTLYLHVFDWPTDGKLVVPGLTSRVTGARLFAGGKKLTATAAGDDVIINLPPKAPDAIASVIALKFKGPLSVVSKLPAPAADGSISLPVLAADIHNNIKSRAHVEGAGESARVTDWTVADAKVSWDFQAPAGQFRVLAEISGTNAGQLKLTLVKATQAAAIPAATDSGRRTVELGGIEVPSAGEHTLQLQPEAKDWKGFDLHGVTLVP